MPITDILVLAVIIAAFVAFGATLAWGDHQTRDITRESRRKALTRAEAMPLVRRTAYAERTGPEKSKMRDAAVQA